MKKTIIILMVICCVLLCNCKKEYVCECSNSGGKFNAFSIKDTKQNSKQKCNNYYNDNYGSNVLNETECKIR